ncbi:MAG: hypothetical protein F4Y39_09805 [Gemmatimonadetes bacterium]|nr:hypothetical protein [Gemmatimonadota bacterium]MYG80900.1 hypothetical protein [Gemmatimonadota bacterium]
MRMVCITLGLFMVSFSTAAGDDFVNFSPRTWSPFFPSKGLLLGGSYANMGAMMPMKVIERYIGEGDRPQRPYVEVTYWNGGGKTDTRFIDKLTFGALGGAIGAGVSLLAMWPFLPEDYCLISISDEEMKCGDYDHLHTVIWSVIYISYIGGGSLGVSWVDSDDSFSLTLIGGLIGGGVGIAITSVSIKFWPSLFLGPIAGAYIGSEISRKFFEFRRLSVGFAPDRDGNLSALATLRF